MTLIVQNDTGSEAGANAYIDVAWFKEYHDARGNDYSAATDDPAIERAIIKATDYLDTRFSFVGRRRNGRPQTTEWPRTNAYDADRNYITDLPEEVKEATAEYALRAIAQELVDDPTRDPSGREVASRSESVGPIKESVTYKADGPGSTFSMPTYPLADRKLTKAGLTRSGGTLVRG